jgi:hypothetical protein
MMTGTAKDLVIENTSTSGNAIQFINEASNNTVKYCTLRGVRSSTTSGVIVFSTTTGTNGNDNNTIDNCDIRDGASTPYNLVYSSGSTTSVATANSNNVISNCNIYNWFYASGDNRGIYLAGGTTDWTITGNSFYQTASRALGSGYITAPIYIVNTASGNNFTITNNYVGGSAPLGGGGAMTYTGAGVMRLFYLSTASSVPNSIQGNVFKNISFTTSSASTSQSCISVLNGAYNIGNVSGNTLGDPALTNSIAFTGSGTSAVFCGMLMGTGTTTLGAFNIQNNVIAGIAIGGTGTTNVRGISVQQSATPTAASVWTVSNNTIGSTSVANSISNSTANGMIGIAAFIGSATLPVPCTISNNTIANLTCTSTGTGTSNWMAGIHEQGSGSNPYYGVYTTTNNTIRNLSSSSGYAGATVYGINHLVNTDPGQTVSGNTIHTLVNTNPGAINCGVRGMWYSGPTVGTNLVARNLIHSLSMSSTSTSAFIQGMIIGGGNATFQNNMIRLGIDAAGSGINTGYALYGIYESVGTNNLYFNSIYIGGTGVSGTTSSTYAFYSAVTVNTRNFMNNIFFNARSGGTTGKHYGIQVAGTGLNPTGLTSNFNLILANGSTGGTFGYYGADMTTLTAWKNATGQDLASGTADPNFVAPAGTSATVDLHVQNPTPIEAAGWAIPAVTDDFDGAGRAGLTPTDIGADAGNFTSSGDIFGPNIIYTPLTAGTTSNRVLTNFAVITDNVGVSGGASLPRIYYKKTTDGNVFLGNGAGIDGWKYTVATNSTSPYSFLIDYSLLNAGSVAAGDVIQYFVVAQDDAYNFNSQVPGATFSANPPVQNVNGAPTISNIYSYSITGAISGIINVGPGNTYTTLTGAAPGGLFQAINASVVTGNLTINITGDITEPGTNALNQWAEEPMGSNFTMTIQPDATTLRTLSGTVTTAAGMIPFNGADRVTINGGGGKYLLFRNTNATASTTGPAISYTGTCLNNTLTNCLIESNATTATRGTVTLSGTTTGMAITTNEVRDPTGGTAGIPVNGIYGSASGPVNISGNYIYNFSSYGIYLATAPDGCVINGNSFFYNSATPAATTQYSIYLSGGNGHIIQGNFIGGQTPLCGGIPWTNTGAVSFYGISFAGATLVPSNILNNTIQNISLTNTGSASLYGIYASSGIANFTGNLVGSLVTPNSIVLAGTGTFYGLNLVLGSNIVNSIQGNTIQNISMSNTSTSPYFYGIYCTAGLVNIGTTTGNLIGHATVGNAITYNGAGYVYGIYLSSTNTLNNVENNIIGNISFTNSTGTPYFRGIYIYGGNVRKNKVFAVIATGAGLTPNITGIYNYGASGATNEYSNNLVSLDGGLATNPVIYGFYDNSYSSSFYNIYYNSIYISGPPTGTSSTYAFYRSVAATYTLRNNIFANLRTAGGTGKHYSIYISSTGSLNSNYNDLYSLAGPLGYYSADQATLANWQAGSGGDANSQNVDPQFVSVSDLHTARPELNNSGITVPAVTTDYSGAARGNPPDIGAYEFSVSPLVVTTAASGISGTGATLNGNVTANNETVVTSFDWGPTTAYGNNVAATPSPVTGLVLTPISATIGSLIPNSTYHFQAKGMVGATPYTGGDQQFTTSAVPPTVTTDPATAVTSVSATLNGTVNANNASTTVTFEYGTTIAYGTTVTANESPVSGTTNTAVTFNLTGLTPNQLYHFRVVGASIGGTSNGNDLTFTTTAIPPAVTTDPASAITTTGATLNGTVNANNQSTTVTFEFGTTTLYGTTYTAVESPVTGYVNTAVTFPVTGLAPNTVYHYRAVGQNGSGTTYGLDQQFTTSTSAPAVTTDPATAITGTGATLNGTVNANNETTTVTFEFGPTTLYGTTYTALESPVTGYVNTPVTYPVTGLTPNSTYHFRAVGQNATGTTYGLDQQFSTSAVPPTVITESASSITGTTATLNGTVNANNASTTVTFEYGTTISYGTTVTANESPVTGTSNTPVTYNLTGLTPNQLYHFRVVGTSTGGTSYGNDSTFTTPAIPPTAITDQATLVTNNSARMNGIINANNASTTVTFEWGLNTSYGSTAPGIPGTVTGTTNTAVYADLSGLVVGTTYHYRVVGVNSAGTTYGLDTNFTTGCPSPAAAGPITGPQNVCQGVGGYNYHVDPIANATGYAWTVPAGATITAGANTTDITVSYGISAVSGNVSVYGTSVCGNGSPSSLAITVNSPPVPTVSGPTPVCAGSTGNVYTTQGGMIGYTWAVSAGGTITGGAGTSAITVTWNTAGAQTVSVNYTTPAGCTAASPTVFPVTVNALPVPTITGPTPVCAGSTGNVYTTQGGMTGYTWAVSAGGTITAGSGTSAITVTWNTVGAQTVSVNYTNANGCTAASPTVYPVTVNALPVPTITGPTPVCAGSAGNVYTTQAGMTGYTWAVSAGGTITAGAGTSAITVTWNTAGAQTVSVNYTNANGCTAASPTVYPVTVNVLPVPTITGPTPVCAGTTGNVYTTQAGMSGYIWAISAGGTITAGSGTSAITVTWNTAGAQTVSVNYTNAFGCTAASPTVFPVTVNALPVPTIAGPTTVCAGSTGNIYSTQPGMTGYNWAVSPGGTITAGSGTFSITVTWTTAGAQSVSVNYTNANGCTAASPTVYPVTVNAVPPTPFITGPTAACVGTTGAVYTTQAGYLNYVWIVSPGGNITSGSGTNSITVTWVTPGSQSVSVSFNNAAGCNSGTTVFPVTVNPLPLPTISGPNSVCAGTAGNVYTTEAGMFNYTWSVSAGGTITAGTGTNAITVTWNTSGAQSVSVNYSNSFGCWAPAPTVYAVTVKVQPVPTITGPTSMCVNSGYYDYYTEGGMTGYQWNVSPGGIITWGAGTQQIQVNWTQPGAQWVSVNYTSPIGCTATNPTVLDVTVSPYPGPAGTITGTSSACGGGTGNYYVAPIPDASSYVWTLPAGFTITSGAGTNSITVSFAPDASSGDVTVYGNNLCGNGTVSPPFPVTITPLPADAGPITGQAAVCSGESGVNYFVDPIAGASGYVWTLPAGATIVGGANTNSITVDFSPGAVSGVITVYGTNTCGNGVVSPDFNVTVNPIPPTPVITLNGYILTSDAPLGNQWYFNGSPIIGATDQTYDATLSGTGTYWTVVTLNGCSSDTSNNIYVLVVGTGDPSSPVSVVIYPNPSEGTFTVMIASPKHESCDLRIYSNLGALVFEKQDLEVNKIAREVIDIRPAPNGVYTIVLTNKESTWIRKLIINK